jgi:Uma2 family endonuclease
MSQVTDPPRTALEIDPRPFLSHPDALYEVVDGQVVELAEMGTYAAIVATYLAADLVNYLRDRRIGWACTEGSFILDRDRDLRRRPDVAFVSHDRWPADCRVSRRGDLAVVPDLVVEVLSPNDAHDDVSAKTAEYFQYGVRQVWLVESLRSRVWVFTTPDTVRILTEADTLDGGDLLPGFSIPVARLFDNVPN